MKNVILIVISSLLSAFLAIFFYKKISGPQVVYANRYAAEPVYTNFEWSDPFSGNSQRTFISSSPTDFISAAKRVTPAVVNIRAVEKSEYTWWGSGSYGASSGSGVIVSADGFIVTNNHVIEDGNQYEVTLHDRREYEARLIATDPSTDLALLKIDEADLPYLVFGNSDSLQVGEWVMAVGNPFNLESTVTAGIVSAKGRSIDILEGDYTIESFIQTDAAVNPGNSGGALVNTNGELVGINTAIITRSGKYEGYSFAIPATLVQKVIKDLRDYGEVRRGLLGVRIGPVNGQNAKELGLPNIEGVYISRVTPHGGAEEAGLLPGDVIVGINNDRITTIPELQEKVGRLHPGTTIEVEYIRHGKRFRTSVTLKDKNQRTAFASTRLSEGTAARQGFELRELNREEKHRLRVSGVYVENIELGSTIEQTKMDPGYIVTHINDVKVSSVEELVAELKKNKGKEVYLQGFYENYPEEYYYKFRVK
ncbi:MAG TPA: Do family serine endopeptidase [Bacteroidetes bacterium]|nr:Do family serine endopeptidase [Bacteroidota bacterium]